jgi:hypothetical protein
MVPTTLRGGIYMFNKVFLKLTMNRQRLLKKNSKRNQNPSRYYNSITNLKFQHKLKYHLSKILI